MGKAVRATLGGIILVVSGGNKFFGWFRSFDYLQHHTPTLYAFITSTAFEVTLIVIGLSLAASALAIRTKPEPKSDSGPVLPAPFSFVNQTVSGRSHATAVGSIGAIGAGATVVFGDHTPTLTESRVESVPALAHSAPRVILSSTRNGTDVRVEATGTEVINVRLVPANSKNYRLRSEVIRYLRVGYPEKVVFHAEPLQQEREGRRLSDPSLFFQDLYPPPEGEDFRDVCESALKMLSETQLAIPLELAYSGPSGKEHYRASFIVRWCHLQGLITDVEPKGIQVDTDPPSTAPLNVIEADSEERIDYACWTSADTISASDIFGCTASVIEVKNMAVAKPKAATGVAAALLFNSDSGEQLTVPNAKWMEIHRHGTTFTREWTNGIAQMEGGESQYFALWFSSINGEMQLYRDDGWPIGTITYGHWIVTIQVMSMNFTGFEAVMGFTYSRDSGFVRDDPRRAIIVKRKLPAKFP